MRNVLRRIKGAWRIFVVDPEICYVNDQVLMQTQTIRYMYREQPLDKIDSGWRFGFSRDAARFTEKPRDYMLYKLEMIMRYDPAIVRYLDLPVGSALERVGNSDRFLLLN